LLTGTQRGSTSLLIGAQAPLAYGLHNMARSMPIGSA
jgi:hypothetical protein